MELKVSNLLKKAWHDPVGASIIGAGFVALFGALPAYYLGWWPSIQKWGTSYTALPNWYIFTLCAIAVLSAPAVILKIFPARTNELHSEIQKLIAESLDKSSSVSTMLMKAKALAKKVDDRDFLDWAEKELTGSYKNLTTEHLPEYRQTYGELKSFNPYRGWESVQFADAESREIFTYAPTGQDIGSLEETLKKDAKGTIVFNHSPSQKQTIFKSLEESGSTDFQLIISFTSIHRIVDAVRHRIHDWALNLENK